MFLAQETKLKVLQNIVICHSFKQSWGQNMGKGSWNKDVDESLVSELFLPFLLSHSCFTKVLTYPTIISCRSASFSPVHRVSGLSVNGTKLMRVIAFLPPFSPFCHQWWLQICPISGNIFAENQLLEQYHEVVMPI